MGGASRKQNSKHPPDLRLPQKLRRHRSRNGRDEGCAWRLEADVEGVPTPEAVLEVLDGPQGSQTAADHDADAGAQRLDLCG